MYRFPHSPNSHRSRVASGLVHRGSTYEPGARLRFNLSYRFGASRTHEVTSFQWPSEMTSTSSSITLMAV